MRLSTLASFSISALCLLSLVGVAQAGDIAIDVRADESDRNRDGGFLELGVAAIATRSLWHSIDPDESEDIELEFEFSVSAGYRFKNLFIEGTDEGFDGLNLGVTLAETRFWDVDLLVANVAGNITIESDEPPPPETEAQRNTAILERDSLFIAAGPRLTGYFDDTIVQFRLVADWYEGNGFLGSARVGRQWQVGNVNLQAIVGANYYSREFSDYLYGVTAQEQSERFPQYSASSALIPEIELGLSKPLRRDWVYRSRLRLRQYPSSISDSPLTVRDSDIIFTNGIHYVF